MSDLRRTFSAGELLVRADGGDGRTISGLVVPFGVTTMVRDAGGPAYEESFQRGAFSKTLKDRKSPVRLMMHHDDLNPLGVASTLEERDEGLFGEFRVSQTRAGDDALALAGDGALSFSVGFIPVQPSPKVFGRSVVRTEVKLREVSLVTFPAYEGAQVTGVRSLADLDPDELTDEQIASLARRMDALVAARATATPESGAGTGRPPEGHLGRVLTGLTAAQRRERLYPYLTERA